MLVVCGHGIDETVKNDIATAERLRITATTLDGILTVKGQGRGKGGARHALSLIHICDSQGIEALLPGGPDHLCDRAVGVGGSNGMCVQVRYQFIRLAHQISRSFLMSSP